MSGFYSKIEQKKLGLKKIGKDCKISKLSRFISKDIIIGDRCRIDDDVVFKGKIKLGNNIHIARGCTLSGGEKGIILDDFAALSNFVQVFTSTDHYISNSIPAATLNKKNQRKFSNVISKSIKIGKSVLVGSFSVILPGCVIEDFSSVAAHCIVYDKVKKGNFLNTNNIIKTIKLRDFKDMQKKMKILNKQLK
jgi:acetyltransferase-like isoleucine patch superfamily enzyme